ncbi:metal-dependent transcriptional regulator [Aeromicrobium sp. CF4.19]|uniref:metal-dependent transcriptional regulator n=1 Tax=Aeromicrobium sp. CF4.19 TaxID=3373082 RepID=UPI003EE4DBD7
MPSPELPSASQDYLKVIWTSREWSDEKISSRAIARRLEHSPSTVSETIKRLAAQGLVTHERYGDVELTADGRRVAVAMVRRHRLIETFLVEYLGYAWDEVHDEAEVLEHAVSDDFVERLAARLGHPERDPHGDPIPSASGRLPDLDATRLSELAAPASVRVARVSDADGELLRYLDEHAIALDTAVQVVERHDAAGTLAVDVAGTRLQLGLQAAEAIWVVPA